MPLIARYAIAVIFGYLLGSLPVGVLVVRVISGQDIRAVGSGRTGGTNAMRAAGVPAGVLTGLGDMAKGFAAVYMARLLSEGAAPGLEALAAVAAVAGHNWPIFLKFKGGAGTGPNAGAATALWPWTAAILIPAVPLILYLTGYASVASTAASLIIVIIFALRAILLNEPIAYVLYAIGTTIMTAIALIPNYKRLVSGTERRVGPRGRKAADGAAEIAPETD